MSQSRSQRRTSLSAATLAGDRRSRLGLFGSAALHAAVIAATLFTWQHSLQIADETPPVVPVDLVTIGEKTNIAPVAPKEDFKPKEETPVTAPTVDQTTPPSVQMATPDVEEAPPPETAPSERLPKSVPPPVVPKQRPRPAPDQQKQKFDVNNILALLDKQKPAASAARGKTGPRAIKGVGAENAMTMDLVDALRNQIAQCWSPPVGAPKSAELVVDFDVVLNPDGTVVKATSDALTSSNSYTRAAASAAQRAIYTCAPYKLPADRYSQWREIDPFHFDPRQMMGQ